MSDTLICYYCDSYLINEDGYITCPNETCPHNTGELEEDWYDCDTGDMYE